MKDQPLTDCEFATTIGDTWVTYCTISADDRSGRNCKECRWNMDTIEMLAALVVELDVRVKWLGA